MNKMMIETKGLTKVIRGDTIVKDVDLKVPKGKIYGLLGPNGAGKSTTLKMLTGISKITSGEVYIEGEPFSRDKLSKIGSQIESPNLYAKLTAIDNLKIQALVLDVPYSRITEVLEEVDLRNTGKKKTSQFSMGMKQRLALAMALLNDPEVLILDEPTNGLDPMGIQALREMFKKMAKRGKTIIIASHILAEIEQIADTVGIINKGKLIYQEEWDKKQSLETVFMNITSKSEDI